MLKKLVLIIIYGLSFVYAVVNHYPAKLEFGDFRVGVSEYAVGIDNLSNPGIFYSISPYDDILILEDGSEVKLSTALPAEEEPSKLPVNITERASSVFKDNLNLVIYDRLEFYRGQTKVYSLSKKDNTLLVKRHVPPWYKGKRVVGVGRSVVLKKGDRLLLDSEVLEQTRQDYRSEAQLITVISKKSPQILQVKIRPRDLISYDPAFRVLTVKSFFDNQHQRHYQAGSWIVDQQEVVIRDIFNPRWHREDR